MTPLHTLATFMPNMESGDLHIMVMAEKRHAWENEETALLWKEEAVSSQEIIALD